MKGLRERRACVEGTHLRRLANPTRTPRFGVLVRRTTRQNQERAVFYRQFWRMVFLVDVALWVALRCPVGAGPGGAVAFSPRFDGSEGVRPLRKLALVGASAVVLASCWQTTTSPNPSGATYSTLQSVACVSTSWCMAVGSSSAPAVATSLAEHWNGTAWSIVSSPSVTGAEGDRLAGVSCVSASNCFAVGNMSTASAVKTLVEHWNGKTWTVMASPNGAGVAVNASWLLAVSCGSASSCFAVGYYYSLPDDVDKLIEHWDGKAWTIVASPSPPEPTRTVRLTAVSCVTASNCDAVGSSTMALVPGSTSTLIEHWNGKAWSIVPSPNAPGPGSTSSSLAGLSCVRVSNCSAVGSYTNFSGSEHMTLIEHWNGTAWSIVSSPNATGATESELGAVACVNTTNCQAVGSSSNGTVTTTLVERFNGTAWSIVSSPNVTGATTSELFGLSCPSTTNCQSVGDSTTSSVTKTLTERYS